MNLRDGGAYGVGSKSYSPLEVKGISGEQVYGMAEARVRHLLAFQMHGRYGLDDVASILVAASSRRVSINQACKDMTSPDESTIRHHLSKLSMDRLQDRVGHALIDRELSILPERPLKVAMDITSIPYHGRDDGRWVRRGRAKHGTTWFFCYATAYVILYGRRITLALRPISREERHVDVVEALLDMVEARGVRIACLFLDKGFYNIEVINHLEERRMPFVMPVVCRGRSGGVRRLLEAGKSYTTTYTLRRFRDGVWRQASFRLLVVRKHLHRDGSRCYGYATNTGIELRRVYREYRRRFGIESSYRLMNQSRARTSTRDAVRRLLLVAVSLLLANLWTYLKWTHMSQARRGRHGRTVREELLPYATLLLMLLNTAQSAYGTVKAVPSNDKFLRQRR